MGGVFLLVQFAMVFLEIKRLLSWAGAGIQLVRKHITYLNFVKKVTMLVRGEKFRASK
jgi:hypothetical protein